MAEKDAAVAAILKEAPRATDRLKSHPYFTQRVRLHSFHAQHVFDRGFDLCASAIFTISVVLRIVGSDDQAQEVEGVVDQHLSKVIDDIRAEAARLDKLAESNGIEFAGIDYSHPREVEAKITSPRAVRYIALIREYDALVAKLDTLWLSGVISDGVYSRSIYDWKRRILRLAGTIRTISFRAMTAARRRKTPTVTDTPADVESTAPGM